MLSSIELMQNFLSISFFVFVFILSGYRAKCQKNNFIDPTGIYKFSGKTVKKNGETYGYFGTIMVLLLDSSKILMNFYVCKGAPSYNSGSFIDTLDYSHNQAVYRGDTTVHELTCKLTFNFTLRGLYAEMIANNPNWACGFGHAVDAQGFYKRIKGRIPSKEEILNDGE